MSSAEAELKKQIQILEGILRRPENSTCSDCPAKTPRWASTTFGTFVCLRCSGQHRSFGTHITKVKSVNLDKWMPGKVEAYQAVNNNLVNAYWEANLPRNFIKPGTNASGHEVTSFLTDKYVNKRWVDKDMKHDPMFLYENKKSRFDKFVKRQLARQGVDVSEGDDSDDDVKVSAAAKKPKPAPPKAKNVGVKPSPKPAAPAKDLINLSAPAASSSDQFSDFVQAVPTQITPSVDDGFTDFKQSAHPSLQHQQQKQIDNLMSMYSQYPNTNVSNTKYAALEIMNEFGGQQRQPPAPSQMPNMPGAFGQQQQQMAQQQQMQQQQQPAGGNGGFQPQFFNSAAAQQHQHQQQQQQQQQQQFGFMQQQQQQQNQGFQGAFGGMQQQQQQPQFQAQFSQTAMSGPPQQQQNLFNGLQQQPQSQQSMGGFGSFQQAPSQQPSNQFYGGLVDLSNKNMATQAAPMNQGFGGFNQAPQPARGQNSLDNIKMW